MSVKLLIQKNITAIIYESNLKVNTMILSNNLNRDEDTLTMSHVDTRLNAILEAVNF